MAKHFIKKTKDGNLLLVKNPEPHSSQLLKGEVAVPVLSEIDDITERIRKRAGNFIVETGKDLLYAKELVAHGEWGTWLESNFNWSPSTAQNYINAAKLVDKNPNFWILKPATLIALAAPNTPEEVKLEVAADIEKGEVPAHKSVKQMIDTAKGKKPKAQSIPAANSAPKKAPAEVEPSTKVAVAGADDEIASEVKPDASQLIVYAFEALDDPDLRHKVLVELIKLTNLEAAFMALGAAFPEIDFTVELPDAA